MGDYDGQYDSASNGETPSYNDVSGDAAPYNDVSGGVDAGAAAPEGHHSHISADEAGGGLKELAAGAGALVAGSAATTAGAAAAAGLGGGVAIGLGIEHTTHLGSNTGEAAFEHSNYDDAHAAAVSMDDASSSLDKGNYVDAAGHAAESFGHMAEGLWNGNKH